MTGLSRLSSLVSGVRWGTLSIVTVTVFQLVFMGIMARLLNPADFGLVAIANVALRFFSYFAQMGIAPALIQKPLLEDGDVHAALALSLGISSLFSLLAVLAADAIERFFGMESLALVIQVLALNFIISGFSSVQLGLIKRSRKFKALAIIEIVSYVIGYGLVGSLAAYFGAGVWALVAAFISQSSLTAMIGFAVIRHPIGFRHTKEQRQHFIGFGGRYSVIGFVEFLTSNIDSLVVGKLMGPVTAGLYNRALLLANLPVQNPTRVLTQALFPIMSSLGDQHGKQSIGAQLGALLVGSYAFAVGAGISIAAPEIVRVLLGDKWLATIPVLQVLACAVGPIYMSNVMGVILDSMAQLATKLRIQTTVFVVLVVLMFYAARSGSATNVALAVVVAGWARLCFMTWVVTRLLRISKDNSLRVAGCVGIVAVASGIMVYAASHLLFDGFSTISRLIAEMLFGAIGLWLGLLLSRSVVSTHPAVSYLAGRMPSVARIMRL